FSRGNRHEYGHAECRRLICLKGSHFAGSKHLDHHLADTVWAYSCHLKQTGGLGVIWSADAAAGDVLRVTNDVPLILSAGGPTGADAGMTEARCLACEGAQENQSKKCREGMTIA